MSLGIKRLSAPIGALLALSGLAFVIPQCALAAPLAAELGPQEVEIAITHCGICHSDLHLISNDWGMSQYPFIPGHEIVGWITAVGEGVSDFAPLRCKIVPYPLERANRAMADLRAGNLSGAAVLLPDNARPKL